jgi:hypothetical protein
MKVRYCLRIYASFSNFFRQYVEFAGMEDEADDRDESSMDGYDVQLPNPNAEKANSQQAKSLEALLALKNKRMLEELTKFRVNPPIHKSGTCKTVLTAR